MGQILFQKATPPQEKKSYKTTLNSETDTSGFPYTHDKDYLSTTTLVEDGSGNKAENIPIDDSLASWGFLNDGKWKISLYKIDDNGGTAPNQWSNWPEGYNKPTNPVWLKVRYEESDFKNTDHFFPFANNVFNIGGADGTVTWKSTTYTVVALGADPNNQWTKGMFPGSDSSLFFEKKHLPEFKINFSDECKVIKIGAYFFQYSLFDFTDYNQDFYLGDSLRWIGGHAFENTYFKNFKLTNEFNLNKVAYVEEQGFAGMFDYDKTTGKGASRIFAIQRFNLGTPAINEPFHNRYESKIFESTFYNASENNPLYIRWNLAGSPEDYPEYTFTKSNANGNNPNYYPNKSYFDGMFGDLLSNRYSTIANKMCEVRFEVLSEGFRNVGLGFFNYLRTVHNTGANNNGYKIPSEGQSFSEAGSNTYNTVVPWVQLTIPYDDESIKDWGLKSGELVLYNENDNKVRILAKPGTTFDNLAVHDTITYNNVKYDVIRIGEDCFKGCQTDTATPSTRTLTFVNDSAVGEAAPTRPFNIQEFGRNAFSGVVFTGSLVIPEGVTKIGSYAFEDCGFTDGTLTLPSTLGTGSDDNGIWNYAFENDKFTGELKIPSSVKKVLDGAFFNCDKFTSVVLENSINEIGTKAFGNMSAVEKLYINGWTSLNNKSIYGITVEGDREGNPFTGWAASLVSSVERVIVTNCVSNIKTPEELMLDSTYWEIKEHEAESADVAANTFWSVLDNTSSPTVKFTILSLNTVGVTRSSSTTSYSFTSSGDTEVTFPDTVNLTISGGSATDYKIVRIEPGLFQNCTGINKTIKFGKYLKSIGNSAFTGSGITGLKFSTDAVLETIEDDAFVNCANLEGNITFPNTLKHIGLSAFRNCTKIGTTSSIPVTSPLVSDTIANTITMSNNIDYIGSGAFGNCPNITGTIDLHQLSQLGEAVFSGDAKLSKVILENTKLTTISANVFNGCSDLTQELILPWTITSIQNQAFYNCGSLYGEINIPSEVTSIGPRAFAFCSGLTGDLIIPRLTRTIGTDAFFECDGLTGKLQMYENVRKIETNAFNGLENITSIVLNWDKIHPSQIQIDDGAFGGMFSAASSPVSTLDGITTNVNSGNDPASSEAETKRYVHITKESTVTLEQLKGLDSSVWEIKKDVDKFDDPTDDEDYQEEIVDNSAKINVAYILVGVLGAVSIGSIIVAGFALKRSKK